MLKQQGRGVRDPGEGLCTERDVGVRTAGAVGGGGGRNLHEVVFMLRKPLPTQPLVPNQIHVHMFGFVNVGLVNTELSEPCSSWNSYVFPERNCGKPSHSRNAVPG